jgi:MraZ protein
LENFIGNINAKVDNKGRVMVPADFRRILQSFGDKRLILRKDIYADCLVLYPAPVWEEKLENLDNKLDEYGKEDREAYRKFIKHLNVVEMDANGRILISKRYLDMVGIISDVCFMGVKNTIEIWAPDRSDESEMDNADFQKFMNNLKGR